MNSAPQSFAVDAMFNACGILAHYIPDPDATHTGDAVEGDVLVILFQPDGLAEFGETRLYHEKTHIQARISELPEPFENDVLVIDGQRYVIQGKPMRDSDRLRWTIVLVPE